MKICLCALEHMFKYKSKLSSRELGIEKTTPTTDHETEVEVNSCFQLFCEVVIMAAQLSELHATFPALGGGSSEMVNHHCHERHTQKIKYIYKIHM